MPNDSLIKAQKAKFDEFYTNFNDIKSELTHYTKYFKNKTVLCNCNDAIHDNFLEYFCLNFKDFELKQVIATSYEKEKSAFKLVVQNDESGLKRIQIPLRGNGDFRSSEMIEILKEADIVVTNPPFSLFREYIDQLVKYNKKFIIMGNINAITYKKVFPLIKENKIQLGASIRGGCRTFEIPKECCHLLKDYRTDENGKFLKKTAIVRWFTNLDHGKNPEKLILNKNYRPEEYPKYDNYDAININKVKDIPYDYNGLMGVPITFLDKYNPDQFEIVGVTSRGLGEDLVTRIYTKEDSLDYGHLNSHPVLNQNGMFKNLFERLLIRKIA